MQTTLLAALCALASASPLRWRFAAMCKLACLLCHLPKFRAMFRSDASKLLSPRDHALLACLAQLDKRGIAYQDSFELHAEHAIPRGRGLLLLTAHFPSNRVLLRWLCNNGYPLCVISILPSMQEALGKELPITVIRPQADIYLQIRKHLKLGQIVYLTVDVPSDTPGTLPLQLPETQLHIQQSVFQFAARAKVDTRFLFSQLAANGKVQVSLRQAPSDPNTAIAQFCEQLRAHVAEVRGVAAGYSKPSRNRSWLKPSSQAPRP